MFGDLEVVHYALTSCCHVVNARDVQQFVHVGRVELRMQTKHAKLVLRHASVRSGTVQLVVRRMDSTNVCQSINQ